MTPSRLAARLVHSTSPGGGRRTRRLLPVAALPALAVTAMAAAPALAAGGVGPITINGQPTHSIGNGFVADSNGVAAEVDLFNYNFIPGSSLQLYVKNDQTNPSGENLVDIQGSVPNSVTLNMIAGGFTTGSVSGSNFNFPVMGENNPSGFVPGRPPGTGVSFEMFFTPPGYQGSLNGVNIVFSPTPGGNSCPAGSAVAANVGGGCGPAHKKKKHKHHRG
jgi:hypothetical protein